MVVVAVDKVMIKESYYYYYYQVGPVTRRVISHARVSVTKLIGCRAAERAAVRELQFAHCSSVQFRSVRLL